MAEVFFFILNLDGEATASEWKSGGAGGVQVDIAGQVSSPVFADFDESGRLDTDSGLLEGADDPVHVAIRVLGLKEDFPGFSGPHFL